MEQPAAAAAAEEQAQSQFSRLPAVLLARILQALPQRDRLASCATVSTSWAAAATAATVEVHVSDTQNTNLPAFQPWLNQHARQLLSLKGTSSGLFRRGASPTVCLPCGQLQQLTRLDLEGLELLDTPSAGSSSSSSSSSAAAAAAPELPKLQQLKLQDCRLGRAIFAQLAQLSGVTRLKLAGRYSNSPLPMRQQDVELMLQGLPNLAHLGLAYAETPAQHILALPAASLTALPVDLRGIRKVPEDMLAVGDSLSSLVCLQKLKLTQTGLSPVALASLSRLTRLQLYGCWSRRRGNHEESQAGSEHSVPALLAAIGGMHQLQHLELEGEDDCLHTLGQPVHCAALTASSQLTHLQIWRWVDQPLPGTAVQHMFPAGRQLSQLQQLVLSGAEEEDSEGGCITTDDLHSIVGACPALRCLSIPGVLAAGADVSALLQLPSTCASLALGGYAVGDEAAGVVAQLTQLTALDWSESPGLTDAGLQLLTALEALETLRVEGSTPVSHADSADPEGLNDDGPPPDSLMHSGELYLETGDKSVSQQLRDLLLGFPTNASWMRQLEQQGQQCATAMQERLRALSSFTDSVLGVMLACAGDTEAMTAVRSMADIGRSLLAGDSVVGSEGAAGALQRFLQLQGRVRASCSSRQEATAALASMEAAVKQAVGGGG